MQHAWNEADLRLVLGAEASIFEYNDNGEPKRDEIGDLIVHMKEYLVAANSEGDYVAFVGNADLDGTSTLFCVDLSGENFQVPHNQDGPPNQFRLEIELNKTQFSKS